MGLTLGRKVSRMDSPDANGLDTIYLDVPAEFTGRITIRTCRKLGMRYGVSLVVDAPRIVNVSRAELGTRLPSDSAA